MAHTSAYVSLIFSSYLPGPKQEISKAKNRNSNAGGLIHSSLALVQRVIESSQVATAAYRLSELTCIVYTSEVCSPVKVKWSPLRLRRLWRAAFTDGDSEGSLSARASSAAASPPFPAPRIYHQVFLKPWCHRQSNDGFYLKHCIGIIVAQSVPLVIYHLH